MKFRTKTASALPYGPFMPLAEFHQFIGNTAAVSDAEVELMTNGLLARHLNLRDIAPTVEHAVQRLDFDGTDIRTSAMQRRLLAMRVCRLLAATGASALSLSQRQHALRQTYRFMRGKYADAMPSHSHENVVDALRAHYYPDYNILKKNKESPNNSMGLAYEALSWSGLFGYMATGWPLARKK